MLQDYNWIAAIIASCNNSFHFEAADRLIELFESRHADEELTVALLQLRIRHWNHIHSILK